MNLLDERIALINLLFLASISIKQKLKDLDALHILLIQLNGVCLVHKMCFVPL